MERGNVNPMLFVLPQNLGFTIVNRTDKPITRNLGPMNETRNFSIFIAIIKFVIYARMHFSDTN